MRSLIFLVFFLLFQAAFHAIDTEDTGFITAKQLMDVMLQQEIKSHHHDEDREATINHLHEEVSRVFDAVDVEHTGKISIREFIGATIQRRTYMQENILHKVFDHFDPGHTGRITIETLTAMLHKKARHDDYDAAEMADTQMARMMRDSIKLKQHENAAKWGMKFEAGGGGGMHRTKSVHALHKENWDRKMVHEAVSKVEADDDGYIDFQEFLALFQGSGGNMRKSSRKITGRSTGSLKSIASTGD